MAVNYPMTNETYFQLEGEFLGVCALDGYKLKYLRLRTADRDVIVKVPKELRLGMVYQLTIGDRIHCEGIQKDGKFKASAIEKTECRQKSASNLTGWGRWLDRVPHCGDRWSRLVVKTHHSDRRANGNYDGGCRY